MYLWTLFMAAFLKSQYHLFLIECLCKLHLSVKESVQDLVVASQ